jgi:hypothetical protein
MKWNLLFFTLTLIFILFLTSSALAQQDPFDPGEADTLYFVPGDPCSVDGDTLYFPWGGGDVTIYINIWNDEDLKGISVPLIDLSYGPPSNAFLDSSQNNGAEEPLCFVGSRIEGFEFKSINLNLQPPQVLYGAVGIDSLPPGEGLFATMIYTVEDTGTICLDTLLFPPENTLKFVTPPRYPLGFTPQFVPRCFHLRPYLCGDANGDEIVNIVDAAYLANYLFKAGPAPVSSSDVNCDGETDVIDITYLLEYLFRLGFLPCDPDNDGQPDC